MDRGMRKHSPGDEGPGYVSTRRLSTDSGISRPALPAA